MKTTGWFLAGIVTLSLAGFGLSAEQAPSTLTYTKDVAPILFRNCTSCHRPGEIAPMSLLTFDDVRPHAKDIRDEVSEGHMPPWHAAAPKGTFLNERGLTPQEKDVLVRWVAAGAPKGDPKDLPPTPVYPDGWAMGKPDVVFEMLEEYTVPAEGVIEYEYFYIPTNFTEAKWIQAIELRPGNREVVHHALAFYRATPDMKRPPVLRPNRDQMILPPPPKQGTRPQREEQTPSRMLATYAPGTNPQVLRPGTAIRLEPGGVIELQMHYTANGKAAKDRTEIGFQFSKDPSPREVRVTHFFTVRCRCWPALTLLSMPTFVCERWVCGASSPHPRSRDAVAVHARVAGRDEEGHPSCRPTTSTGRRTTSSRSRSRSRRRQADVDGMVRQLHVEQGQPGSDGDGEVGRSDVGGDAVHGVPLQSDRRATCAAGGWPDSTTPSAGRARDPRRWRVHRGGVPARPRRRDRRRSAHDPIKTRVTWTGDISL